MVSENPATQIPEVYLGFISYVEQTIPASTNKMYAPRYADTFGIDQGINPFTWKVQENTAAGDVLVSNSVSIPISLPTRAITNLWDNSWMRK